MKKTMLYVLIVFSILFGILRYVNKPKMENGIAIATKKNILSMINKKDSVIIDARGDEEYNGWKIHSDIKPGHIKEAISFSPNILKNLKTLKDKKNILKEKGLSENKTIVVYSNYGKSSSELCDMLKGLGYTKIYNYKKGMKELSIDSSIKFEKLYNYSKLVYPKWVKNLKDGKKVNNYDGKDFVIIDVNYDVEKSYNKKHIPGSICIDTNEIEGEPLWNLVSSEKLTKLLKEKGITKDTMVILYSEEPMASGRVAAAFMYAGINDVRILNGGQKAWENAGFEFECGSEKNRQPKDFGTKIPVNPQYNIGINDAKNILKDPNGRLVAVVSWDEYTGKSNGGYTYIKEKGRIKGSVFGHGGSDAYHSQDFVDPDGTMRSYKEIEKMWKDFDINKNNNCSFFCGTGWRGGLAFFDAYLMGWKNISVYDGGWYEWSRNPKNPVEYGTPKKYKNAIN